MLSLHVALAGMRRLRSRKGASGRIELSPFLSLFLFVRCSHLPYKANSNAQGSTLADFAEIISESMGTLPVTQLGDIVCANKVLEKTHILVTVRYQSY